MTPLAVLCAQGSIALARLLSLTAREGPAPERASSQATAAPERHKIRHVFNGEDQRSAGLNPIRLATLANMRGPISS